MVGVEIATKCTCQRAIVHTLNVHTAYFPKSLTDSFCCQSDNASWEKLTGKSGKDLPAEFLMDDVYNAERDLVNKDDVTAVKDALTGKNEEK